MDGTLLKLKEIIDNINIPLKQVELQYQEILAEICPLGH